MARSRTKDYVYVGRNPYESRKCQGCGNVKLIRPGRPYCSLSCAGRAPKNWSSGPDRYNWKGDGASYAAVHHRVERSKGKASWCTVCHLDCPQRRYEWANLTGGYGDIEDYASMCVPCHRRYDNARASMEEK